MESPYYIKQPYLKEAIIMAKVKPFHTKEKTDVYHNDNKCTEGNNIEKYNKRPGTGGKRKCKGCK